MSGLNTALLDLAKQAIWRGAAEKQGFQPPGGAAPPMDPSMGGGASPPPTGDPSAMGAGPPGMAPPPMGGAAPPMGGAPMPGAQPPMPGMPGAQPAAPPKMKPEQMMQMIDMRLYNMQQQFTALMNHLGIQIPPGALVMPPGQMSPQPEAALPGGAQDPTAQAGAGGAGGSAIGAIEPMQGASPELAAGGGGGEKAGSYRPTVYIFDATRLPNNFMRKQELAEFLKEANAQAPVGYSVVLQKHADGKANVSSTSGGVDDEGPQVSPPNKALNVAGAPATTPALRGGPTAGGSKDPESVTDGDMPAPKSASIRFAEAIAAQQDAEEEGRAPSYVGAPVERDLPQSKTAALWSADSSPVGRGSVPKTAAAVAAMIRSKTQNGAA